MNTTLQLRWGATIDNPTTNQLLSALADLDKDDEEHPDTWLTCYINNKDWTISAHQNGDAGLLIWNYDNDPETYEQFDLPNVPRDQILQMWHELQRGEIQKIQFRPWQPRS